MEISSTQQKPRIIRITDPDGERPSEAEREVGEAADDVGSDVEDEAGVEGASDAAGAAISTKIEPVETPVKSPGKIEFPAAFSRNNSSTGKIENSSTGNPGQLIEFKAKPQNALNPPKSPGKLADLLGGKWTFKAGKPPWPTGLYEISPKGRAVPVGTGRNARSVTGFQYLRRLVCPSCGERKTRVAGFINPATVAEMQQFTKEASKRHVAFKLLADWRKPLPDDLRCARCAAANQSDAGQAG